MRTTSAGNPSPRRRPIDVGRVADALTARGGWAIRHVRSIGSTNADLLVAAANGAPDGTVLVTEEQLTGRGRLGRSWLCPPGAGLMFSVLLRLGEVPLARRSWTGAALGVAVVTALDQVAGLPAGLKWPNDVLIGSAKVAGILAESAGDALVVGIGLNVDLTRAELPRADATSLALAGAPGVDRADLLVAILQGFGTLLRQWRAAGGDVDASGLRTAYLECCLTLGALVAVDLPDGSRIQGRAVDVAADGAVVIERRDGSVVRMSAGDVVHLRSAAGRPTGASE